MEIEAIRAEVETALAKIREDIAGWQDQGRTVSAKVALALVERDLLGHGCVVGRFDERRAALEATRSLLRACTPSASTKQSNAPRWGALPTVTRCKTHGEFGPAYVPGEPWECWPGGVLHRDCEPGEVYTLVPGRWELVEHPCPNCEGWGNTEHTEGTGFPPCVPCGGSGVRPVLALPLTECGCDTPAEKGECRCVGHEHNWEGPLAGLVRTCSGLVRDVSALTDLLQQPITEAIYEGRSVVAAVAKALTGGET